MRQARSVLPCRQHDYLKYDCGNYYLHNDNGIDHNYHLVHAGAHR